MAISGLKNKAFFVVEDNIGAGKTTFSYVPSEYLPIHVLFKPTNKWQKIVGSVFSDQCRFDKNCYELDFWLIIEKAICFL